MKKQWKLDNKGMTLLEVIVAFAIFAIAATILITGFNGALKVMGNSEAIKNASQQSASDVELELDGDKKPGTVITSNDYGLTGSFYIAETAKKNNDGLSVTQQSFVVDALTKPTAPEPPEEKEEPVINKEDWIHLNPDQSGKLEDVGTGNEQPFYSYVDADTNKGNHGLNVKKNTTGDVYIYVKSGVTLRIGSQSEEPVYPPNIYIILENNTSVLELGKFKNSYNFYVFGRYSDNVGKVIIDEKEQVSLYGGISNAEYNKNLINLIEKAPIPTIPQYVWDGINVLNDTN